RFDKVKYVLDVFAYKSGEKWMGYEGELLLNSGRYPVYEFGDCFLISAQVKRPENFDDFNYENYLARYNIYFLASNPFFQEIDLNKSQFFCTFRLFGVGFFEKFVFPMDSGWKEISGDE